MNIKAFIVWALALTSLVACSLKWSVNAPGTQASTGTGTGTTTTGEGTTTGTTTTGEGTTSGSTTSDPSAGLAPTYRVGATRQYKTPCQLFSSVALKGGDIIEVDAGTYQTACKITASGNAGNPIVVRGAAGPRPILDGTGFNLTGAGSTPRAIFQFNASSHIRVEHLEFRNAAGSDGNGAGWRVTEGSTDMVFDDLSIHDCQMGAMSDSSDVTLTGSEIYLNGKNDGYSHNLYLAGSRVVVAGNYLHDSVGGQNVKLRAHYAEVLYNRIENAGNYEIDFVQDDTTSAPNSHGVLIGNLIVRNPNAVNNWQTIVFGSDNASESRNGNLYAFHNTIVLRNASNRLLLMLNPTGSSQAYFYNNIIHTTVSGPSLGSDAPSEARIHGSNNWITTGITSVAGLTGSLTGTNPGFTAPLYKLTSGSPVIDQGLPSLLYVDGNGTSQNGLPAFEAISPFGMTPRNIQGAPDLGAYEQGI